MHPHVLLFFDQPLPTPGSVGATSSNSSQAGYRVGWLSGWLPCRLVLFFDLSVIVEPASEWVPPRNSQIARCFTTRQTPTRLCGDCAGSEADGGEFWESTGLFSLVEGGSATLLIGTMGDPHDGRTEFSLQAALVVSSLGYRHCRVWRCFVRLLRGH